jgi:hypothetical protein
MPQLSENLHGLCHDALDAVSFQYYPVSDDHRLLVSSDRPLDAKNKAMALIQHEFRVATLEHYAPLRKIGGVIGANVAKFSASAMGSMAAYLYLKGYFETAKMWADNPLMAELVGTLVGLLVMSAGLLYQDRVATKEALRFYEAQFDEDDKYNPSKGGPEHSDVYTNAKKRIISFLAKTQFEARDAS